MRYLGIDYGKKTIGLALSQGQVASILAVLKIKGLVDALEKVGRVIDKHQINRVVVGVPESGEALKLSKRFASQLRLKYQKDNVEIIEYDETLTSQDAKHLMADLKIPKDKRKAKEDAYAAAFILQNFLDSLQ